MNLLQSYFINFNLIIEVYLEKKGIDKQQSPHKEFQIFILRYIEP